MAEGRKITENPELTVWASNDVLAIVDISADETKFITVQNLLKVPWTYLIGSPSSVISVGDGLAWTGVNLNILVCTDTLDDVLRRGNTSATRGASFGNTVTVNNGNLIVPSGIGKVLFGTSNSVVNDLIQVTGDQSFAVNFGTTYRNSSNIRKYKLSYSDAQNEMLLRAEHLTDLTGAIVNINAQYAQNSDLSSVNKNSILKLSRGNFNDYETLELLNIGTSGAKKHAIRISKQGIGVLRDFSLEYLDGGNILEIFKTNATTKLTEWKYKVLFSNEIQYQNGSEDLNKVLISDADGNATWEDILNILPPSGTDKYIDTATFNTSNNILTFTRTGGLPNLTVNLSSLADDSGNIPTLQQVTTQGSTSNIAIYDSAGFYSGTTNQAQSLTGIYKFVAYGGNASSLMKFVNDTTTFNENTGFDIGINTSGEGIIERKGNDVIKIFSNGIEVIRFGASNGNLVRLPNAVAMSSVTLNKLLIIDGSGNVGAKTITEASIATQPYVLSVLPTDFVSKISGGVFNNPVSITTNMSVLSSTGNAMVVADHPGGTNGRFRIRNTSNNDVAILNGTSNQFIMGSVTIGGNTIYNTTDVYIDRDFTVGAYNSEFFGAIKMFGAAATPATVGLGLASDFTVTTFSLGGIGGENNYVTSATFNTGNGVITLNRQGLSAITVDIDGRYLQSYTVTQSDVSQHMGAFDGKNILWNGSTLQVNIKTTSPVQLLALDSNGDITSNIGLGTGFSINGTVLNYKISNGTNNYIPKFNSSAVSGLDNSCMYQDDDRTIAMSTLANSHVYGGFNVGLLHLDGHQSGVIFRCTPGSSSFTDNHVFQVSSNGNIWMKALPTSNPGVAGALWRNGNTVMISTG